MRDAGFAQSEIDSGAVILTGEAIKRKNARAIDELFADEAGKFVCATAGHKLECRLAAHGSGAVALSKARDTCLLHVDIGGGTTKLALIDRGTIIGLRAFAVGGRLIAHGRGRRVDPHRSIGAARRRRSAASKISPQALADAAVRRRIAQRLAAVAADMIVGAPLDPPRPVAPADRAAAAHGPSPTAITFSGGVAEYMFGHEKRRIRRHRQAARGRHSRAN